MRHATVAERGTTRPVGHDHGMLRPCDLLIIKGDFLHQTDSVDALLVANAVQIMKGQTGQRDHRRTVERGIIKPIQKMNCAGSRRSDADAEAAGMFRDAATHEGRSLLVAYAHISDLVTAFPKRLDDRVDAVSDDAERMRRAPRDQRI